MILKTIATSWRILACRKNDEDQIWSRRESGFGILRILNFCFIIIHLNGVFSLLEHNA
jgi:hypothetical protein